MAPIFLGPTVLTYKELINLRNAECWYFVRHFGNLLSDQWKRIRIHQYITMTSHERLAVSNHWKFDCLFSSLFKLTSKYTSKLRVTSTLWGNPPVTGGLLKKNKGQKRGLHDVVMSQKTVGGTKASADTVMVVFVTINYRKCKYIIIFPGINLTPRELTHWPLGDLNVILKM